jgi:hypothetical protein
MINACSVRMVGREGRDMPRFVNPDRPLQATHAAREGCSCGTVLKPVGRCDKTENRNDM